jgi:RNA polymerase sigma-70 factor (ECF subfamily)
MQSAAAPEQPDAELGEQIAAFGPRLRAFAYTLTRDRELAADLAQDACTRAFAARAQFSAGTNLAAWLFTILRHLHANHLRSEHVRARMTLVPLDDVPGFDVSVRTSLRPVEHEVVARVALSELLGELDRLPPTFAAALRLVAIEELSYADAATILGVPPGTVMSRVHRARRQLIARLAKGTP